MARQRKSVSANNKDDAAKISRTASLPLTQLTENTYNPNQMEEEDFDDLVAEVRHLGRVPKPIVVRQIGDTYEIVDGAHNFRAACKVGLQEVTCEVVTVDDVEARIQTYKRNQHGAHNPLLEGLMFAEILDGEDGLGKRALARRLDISEGKVRVSLEYVKALKLRIRYAEEEAGSPLDDTQIDNIKETIGRMTQREVGDYLRLPRIIRDRWLAAGKPPFVSKKLHHFRVAVEFGFLQALGRLVDTGIAEHLPSTYSEFGDCLYLFLRYDAWMQTRTSLQNVAPYVTVAAKYQLVTEYLDLLPCRYSGGAGTVIIPVELWSEILDAACARYEDPDDRYALISQRIQAWLRENGISPTEVATSATALLMGELENAPKILRDAEFLSLSERVELFRVVGTNPGKSGAEALETVLAQVERRRSGKAAPMQNDSEARVPVCELFRATLAQAAQHDKDQVFAEPNRLREVLESWIRRNEQLHATELSGRPATEVLIERLAALPHPEIVLLTAAVIPELAGSPQQRWLDAIRTETSVA